jgi:hypothetical protein
MTPTTTRLTAAIEYGNRGLLVFPCHTARAGVCSCSESTACETPGKHPRITGWQRQATDDVEQIRRWWRQWPTANIGLYCKGSGLVVADVDPRNGGAESWIDVATALGSEIAETWTSLTGGGGSHYIYRTPASFEAGTDVLAAGVDVKWDGLIILPPSEHASGVEYTWEAGYGPEDRDPLPLPDRLAERIKARPLPSLEQRERTPLVELLQTECPAGGGLRGGRHKALISILGYLVNRGIARDEAEAIVQNWNARYCRPPLSDAYLVRETDDVYTRYLPPAVALLHEAATGTEPREDGRRYEIVPAPAFMERPPSRWAMRDVLPERSFVCVYGPPGSYKSFAVLDMLACMSLGIPYHGYETVQGSCLLIAGEGSGGLSKRLRAWQRHHGHQLTDAFKILPAAVPLVDAAAVRDLVRDIKSFGESFAAVAVDTLSRGLAGEDENSSIAMTKAS